MSEYDRDFYDFIRPGSLRSARVIIPIVTELFGHPESVADVGCGEGAWLSVWKELSPHESICVHGFDGDYVGDENLLIDPSEFTAVNLDHQLVVDETFDIVQSFEVAEHLPESSAEGFMDMLVSLGDVIVFSAAIPGQIGRGHINEQWPEYWDEKFQTRGYVGSNHIRDLIWENPDVENWYKQNTILYVKNPPEHLADLFTEPITWRIHPNNTHILPPEGQ